MNISKENERIGKKTKNWMIYHSETKEVTSRRRGCDLQNGCMFRKGEKF